ncbi:pirin family protein [Tsukamurella sp. 8F]|uniref:pirin family protein n=1 Tax=unclassified Tsukamurella TaxID=2633480 RepID=UPI0023B9BA5A|nr:MULTISPECIES: pirin family protein [unclassified Tsukamurella]MDF0532550.1 pirin family protein [Tsukamurella sp. 8J]MDF0589487.1 pirin family protein [Tsukamurella sp. 8F]
MNATVVRADTRMRTDTPWLRSRHCFSFGDEYDPENTHHGVLLVSNDETVAAGRGFDTHPHRNTEIVTWVLRGSLVHQDSEGHSGVVYPGLVQRMSAGTGILHSERNDRFATQDGRGRSAGQDGDVRFIQMWIQPDQWDTPPGYAQSEVDGDLAAGGLVAVASGIPGDDAAIRIGNRGAALHVARLAPGTSVTLPDSPLAHLFVTAGTAHVEDVPGDPLGDGDSLRLTGGTARTVVAGAQGAEVLAWEMHSRLGG